MWAAVSAHPDAVSERAAALVIARYTGVLGGADIEISHQDHDVRDHAVDPPRLRS